MNHPNPSEETPPNPSTPRARLGLACGLFVLALAVRLICFTGLIGSDDLGYSKFGIQISTGTYRLFPHHYALRYGVLLPLAAIYRVFGVHEWTTVALPLLGTSLACVLAAFIALEIGGLSAAWITGLLMATFPVDVRYGSVLVPEPIMQVIVLGGALLFLRARHSRSRLLGLGAGVCFGLSYLTKEPGAFVAMGFFAFAVATKDWRLALDISVGAALVVAGEFVWMMSQTGDPLFRLHSMAAHNKSSMAVGANVSLRTRLLVAYPQMMLVPGVDFGLHSLFAIALGIVALVRWRNRRELLLLALWAALPFLYLNFGSSSFSSYWALPVAPRYMSLIYPPLFVLTALTLTAWIRDRGAKAMASQLALGLVCAVGIAAAIHTRGTGYRSDEVRRIRAIATIARAEGAQVCEVKGTSAAVWRSIFNLVDSNRLGCAAGTLLRVEPDSSGSPVSAPLAPRHG